jgi:ribosomal protein L37AE/L43A
MPTTNAAPGAQPHRRAPSPLCKSDACRPPNSAPFRYCKSVARRRSRPPASFAYSMPRMVRCRRMLSSRNDTSRHSITTRAAQRRSPIKPPDRCPHCIKKGTRKKKLEDVPLYRCRSCGRTFSIGPRAISSSVTMAIKTMFGGGTAGGGAATRTGGGAGGGGGRRCGENKGRSAYATRDLLATPRADC